MSLVVAYLEGTKVTYLTNIVTRVSWSGDIAAAARTCVISIRNAKNNDTRYVKSIECGREIRFNLSDGTQLFRGIIFSTEIEHDGSMSITAYDYNYYLTKNSDSKKFVKNKASEIIKEICKQYGIASSTITDTGYVIPRLILRDMTLYDMIITALTETRKKTGKKYLLGNKNGALTLTEGKANLVRLAIKEGSNLISATYTESIEDLKNAVRLTGSSGEDAKGVTVSDNESIKKYGRMQEKQHEYDKSDAQLKPIALALLKELNKVAKESSVEAIGNISVIAGKTVNVYENVTGLSAGYYVITDEHTFYPNGDHKMSLTLSRSLDVAELEYEPPDENTSTINNSNGVVAVGSTKTSSVVNMARSYVGKLKYVFGSKNIPGGTGDCSGFTNYIYKKAAGIDIGHGTSSQIAKGVKISTDNAQPGDIVFFQGTYRSGVSHVGIVVSKGTCVSLASSGCKVHSYTSGYWGNHFMQIRRVL